MRQGLKQGLKRLLPAGSKATGLLTCMFRGLTDESRESLGLGRRIGRRIVERQVLHDWRRVKRTTVDCGCEKKPVDRATHWWATGRTGVCEVDVSLWRRDLTRGYVSSTLPSSGSVPCPLVEVRAEEEEGKEEEEEKEGKTFSCGTASKEMDNEERAAVGATVADASIITNGQSSNHSAAAVTAAKDAARSRLKFSFEGFHVLREGDAEILQRGNDVFYNKAQIVNRDLSIAVLRSFIDFRKQELVDKTYRKPKGGHGSAPLVSERKEEKEETTGNPGRVVREGGGEGASPSKEGEAAQSGKSGEAACEAVKWNVVVAVEMEEKPAKSGTEEDAENGKKAETDRTDKTGGTAPVVPGVKILEALAASGLRAIRYAREVEGVESVMAVDNDKVAVEACERNVQFNGAPASNVHVMESDCRLYMLGHEKTFDVVDLDPYGSPSVFLDSAVQSVCDGGLLACTATDMAVLCGNSGEVCYGKYGSFPVKAKYCHEMALRILLASIESHANRYKRYIVPLISLSVDFYVRVFVRVYTSPQTVKSSPSKLSYVYQCVGCDSFYLQPVGRVITKGSSTRFTPGSGPVVPQACENCGKHFNVGGPLWTAPIHNMPWVNYTLSRICAMKRRYPAFEKIHSILTTVAEELEDTPLYVSVHSLSATLKCTPPSGVMFRSAIVNAGYRVSNTHANPLGLKTDAPMSVIWDIMRCWVKSHPVKAQQEETPGTVILRKEPEIEANFARVHSALSRAQVSGVARYLPNPEPQWGPKPRAGRNLGPKHGVVATEGQSGSKKTEREREGEGGKDGNGQEERESKRVRLEADKAASEVIPE